MRYAIVTDIHANRQAWSAVLKDIKAQGVDSIISLGDVIGYGPSPVEVLESVYNHADHFVLGNHDAVICNKLDSNLFNDNAKHLIEWTREQLATGPAAEFFGDLPMMVEADKFACAHAESAVPGRFGYLYEPEDCRESFDALKQNLLFVGHTHQPLSFTYSPSHKKIIKNNPKNFIAEGKLKYIVNAGSVGDPRDGGTQATYCIFDDVTMEVKYRFVDFDLEDFRRDLLAAQLPVTPFFLMNYDNKVQEAETFKDMAQIKMDLDQIKKSAASPAKLGDSPRKKFKFDESSRRTTRQLSNKSSKSHIVAISVIVLMLCAILALMFIPSKKPKELTTTETDKSKETKNTEPKLKTPPPLPIKKDTIIDNNGFENGLASWVLKNAPKIAFDKTIKKEGAQSIKFTATNSNSYIQQTIEVKPGYRYKFSGYIKTKDIQSQKKYSKGVVLYVVGRKDYPALLGTNGWKKYEISFTANSPSAIIRCEVGNGGGVSGTAWFDDLHLEELPPIKVVKIKPVIKKSEFKKLKLGLSSLEKIETKFAKSTSISASYVNAPYIDPNEMYFSAETPYIWTPPVPIRYSTSSGKLVLQNDLSLKQTQSVKASTYKVHYTFPKKQTLKMLKLELFSNRNAQVTQIQARILSSKGTLIKALELSSSSTTDSNPKVLNTLKAANSWMTKARKAVSAFYFLKSPYSINPGERLEVLINTGNSKLESIEQFRVLTSDASGITQKLSGNVITYNANGSSTDNILRIPFSFDSKKMKFAQLHMTAQSSLEKSTLKYAYGSDKIPTAFKELPMPSMSQFTKIIASTEIKASPKFLYFNLGKKKQKIIFRQLSSKSCQRQENKLLSYKLRLKYSKLDKGFENSLQEVDKALILFRDQTSLAFKSFKSKPQARSNVRNLLIAAQRVVKYSNSPLHLELDGFIKYTQTKNSALISSSYFLKFWNEMQKYTADKLTTDKDKNKLIDTLHGILKGKQTLLSLHLRAGIPAKSSTNSRKAISGSASKSTASTGDPQKISKIYPSSRDLKKAIPFTYKFPKGTGVNTAWQNQSKKGTVLNDRIFSPLKTGVAHKCFWGYNSESQCVIEFTIQPKQSLSNGIIFQLYSYSFKPSVTINTKNWKLQMGETADKLIDKRITMKMMKTDDVPEGKLIKYEFNLTLSNKLSERKARVFRLTIPAHKNKRGYSGALFSEIVLMQK